jgi:hypothetical protein
MRNVEFHNLYCVTDLGYCHPRCVIQMLGLSKNSGKMGEECGMHGTEGSLEQIFDWKMLRKSPVQKACINMVGEY